jgi:hypothetical protein
MEKTENSILCLMGNGEGFLGISPFHDAATIFPLTENTHKKILDIQESRNEEI